MLKQITFITDNLDSWIIPYIDILKQDLKKKKYSVSHLSNYKDIKKGDVLFILSCEKIIPIEYLKYNKYNIVIHPSKLPYGKGWSPMAWQILNKQNEIYITLFEATSKVDSGKIFFRKKIKLRGTELNDEVKSIQGDKTVAMIKEFLKKYDRIKPFKQKGNETFFSRRTKKDSELNINKPIAEQFNLLRVVDNDRYPAYFIIKNQKYFLKIYKENK